MAKKEDEAAVDVADEQCCDPLEEREEQAVAITKNYMMGAMAAGLIPAPAIDLAAITGVQLKMIHALANHYDIEFREHVGKSIIGSVVGGWGVASIATGALFSLMKTIPVIGTTAGIVSLPIVAGASTYALGKVFIQHFESGGTFLDFDPGSVRGYFSEMYKEGEKIAEASKDAVEKK